MNELRTPPEQVSGKARGKEERVSGCNDPQEVEATLCQAVSSRAVGAS